MLTKIKTTEWIKVGRKRNKNGKGWKEEGIKKRKKDRKEEGIQGERRKEKKKKKKSSAGFKLVRLVLLVVLSSDLSMSSIFGLRSSYMLEYCWLFTLLLRAARYFTGVEGKWTPLPPISPPSANCSSQSSSWFGLIFFRRLYPGS